MIDAGYAQWADVLTITEDQLLDLDADDLDAIDALIATAPPGIELHRRDDFLSGATVITIRRSRPSVTTLPKPSA